MNKDDYSAITKHVYNIYTSRPNVFDVGPALNKSYTNVLRLLGGSEIKAQKLIIVMNFVFNTIIQIMPWGVKRINSIFNCIHSVMLLI